MFKNLRRKRKNGGQSTLEYIVLVTGVVAILILFLGPTGPFRKAYNDTMSQGTSGMVNMANRLAASRN